jgi:hypothetical protein
MLTGNNSGFAVCAYENGTRTQCQTGVYNTGQNAGQRRQIYLWNGIACNYDQTVISCVPPNFDNADLYIKNMKVLTCSAEPSGGTCLGNTWNGTFYTP